MSNDHNSIQDFWYQLVEKMAIGVLVINNEGQILYANDYVIQLFGVIRTELIGTNFLYPMAANETQEVEILKSNNDVFTVHMTVRKSIWENRLVWIISLFDITELKLKEKLLKISSKGISSAFEGIIITDLEGIIIETNNAFMKMTGYTEQEVIGQKPAFLHPRKQNEKFYKELWNILIAKGQWSGELWAKKKNKRLFPAFFAISAVKNSDGDIINYIGYYHDLTLIKKQEQQIENFKYYDYLTGLPNKFLLTQRLQTLISGLSEGNKELIVFNIRVFDSNSKSSLLDLPPNTRDKIILEAVNRIDRTTPKKMFFSRIGLSEFIVIYFIKNKIEVMASIAQRMIEKLSYPYYVHHQTIILQTIIGLTAYYKNSSFSAEDLIQQSEIARHKAHIRGVNIFEFFDPQVEERIIEFNKRVESVSKAMQLNELKVYYQPIVELNTAKVVGLEALLRWQHPEKGLLLPKQFLSDLNNHPLSLEIGDWVLHQVLHQVKELLACSIKIPINVNVSAYQLQHPNFVKKLFDTLALYPSVPNHLLVLEILETEAIEDLTLVSQIIAECKAKGVNFSLDDFGTGYASLTFLKELNTFEVKIDQSFIINIFDNPKDLAILKIMIEFCRVIGRTLVAEGVETVAHGKLLSLLGCNLIQGYAIAKPMPAKKLIPWIKNWKLAPEWGENRFSHAALNKLAKISIKHYLTFQSIRLYLENNQTQKPELSLQVCPIERWLLENQQTIKEGKTIKKVCELHHKEHELGSTIIQLVQAGQKEQAAKLLTNLDKLRDNFFKEIINFIFNPNTI
ncbi:TPA: EAL domain-containing protein [Legionella pneumophila]|nr:EAL domain-containing protein [Legionella pneumophila]HCJ1102857.1 EAL domain-containing protein [Legionella pneumophila]HCJ1112334.1 EAL domain-containing protein [Legionella pneumophila]HCJ1115558.1 EAL domain-containing protein [Legionella pneumophila]HCU6014051.1 EAL domain-containing protein [Legionella pneumophila]